MSSTSQTMITSSTISIQEGTGVKDTDSMQVASSQIDIASKDEPVARTASTEHSTNAYQFSNGLEFSTSDPHTHTPITPTKHKYPPSLNHPSSHLPPTPDPTPTTGKKRTYDATVSTTAPSTPSKQPRLSHTPSTPSKQPRLSHTPSRLRSSTTRKISKFQASAEPSISSIELKRAAESILRQVEWELVEDDVAANRRGNVYRRILRNILQDKVDELVEKEEAAEV